MTLALSALRASKLQLFTAVISVIFSIPLACLLPVAWSSLAFLVQVFSVPLVFSLPVSRVGYALLSAVLVSVYAGDVIHGIWLPYAVVAVASLINYSAIKRMADVFVERGSLQFEGKVVFTLRAISVAYCFVYLFSVINLYGNVFSFTEASALNRFIDSFYYSCFIFLGSPPPDTQVNGALAKVVISIEAVAGAGVALGLISMYLARLSRGRG